MTIVEFANLLMNVTSLGCGLGIDDDIISTAAPSGAAAVHMRKFGACGY
jgi:hypothetical protein